MGGLTEALGPGYWLYREFGAVEWVPTPRAIILLEPEPERGAMDESYDMTTIEGCIGWGLFQNPPERRRLAAELARLRAVEAAARDVVALVQGGAIDPALLALVAALAENGS
jgi:hypothetical protein